MSQSTSCTREARTIDGVCNAGPLPKSHSKPELIRSVPSFSTRPLRPGISSASSYPVMPVSTDTSNHVRPQLLSLIRSYPNRRMSVVSRRLLDPVQRLMNRFALLIVNGYAKTDIKAMCYVSEDRIDKQAVRRLELCITDHTAHSFAQFSESKTVVDKAPNPIDARLDVLGGYSAALDQLHCCVLNRQLRR